MKSRSTINSAMIVMSSVILSRIFGYIRETSIPNIFGYTFINSAYQSAFAIPDLMYQLILGGAIAAAIIPTLSGGIKNNRERETWTGISSLINVIIIMTIAACTLGMIYTPQLVKLVAKDFVNQDPEYLNLTVNITRILFPSVAFLMMTGICNGVLNGYHRFAFAAYGPVIYNILSIISIYVFSNNNQSDYFGVLNVAKGIFYSAIIYFVIQLLASLKNIKHYKPKIHFKDSEFKTLFLLAIPALVSSSIYQINVIISYRFSSGFDTDAIAALRTGNTLWQMPLGIIAQGLGIALLPTLSEDFASGDIKNFKRKFSSGVSFIYFMIIPAAIGMFILNKELLKAVVAFSSRITEDNISLTGKILMMYTPALIGQSGITFLYRGFYAMKMSKIPMVTGVTSMIVNLILSYIFVTKTSMGPEGMALAYSLSTIVNLVMLMLMMEAKIKGFIGKADYISQGKTILASIVMGIGLYFLKLIVPMSTDGNIVQILILIIYVVVGVGIYFIISMLIKNRDAKRLWQEISGKLKRLTKRKISA